DPGWAGADLAELQPLGPVEPLHVRGGGADAERGDDLLPHLADLVVEAAAVDAVGRDVDGGDPAGAHRLEDAGEVVAREVHLRSTVDTDGVVEPLVTLDELLDGDRDGAGAEAAEGGLELGVVLDLVRPGSACAVTGLQDQWITHPAGELAYLGRGRGAGGRGGRHTDLPQRLLHRGLVTAEPGRAHRGARDAGGL